MKSVRCTSITRRVPPMQHDLIAVGIGEEGHMADAGVENVPVEDHALLLEPSSRFRNVRHAKCEAGIVRPPEGAADVFKLQQVEKAVVAELELGEAALVGQFETERLAVERLRPLHVGDGHGPEVDMLDDHASNLLCRSSALPSGSWKNAIRQTPVSIVSPLKTTPFASSSARAASTSGTRSARPAGDGANGCPILDGSKTSSVTWPQRNSRSLSPSV